MKFNKTKYSTKSIAQWLFSHSKGCRTQALLNGVIGLALVALGLISVDLFRTITDIATGKHDGSIAIYATALALVFISELLLHIAQTWVGATLGVRTQNLMQKFFFSRLLHGQWKGVEKYHSGDVLNRLFGDVNDIVGLMTEVIPMFITVVVQFVASFIYLYEMDMMLAIILIVISPAFMVLGRLYFRRMRRIVRHIKDSNSSLQSIIQECVQHKMVIKVLQREDSMVDRLSRRQSVLHLQTKSRAKLAILTKSFIHIGFAGSYLIGFVWALYQLQDGIITMGVLMAFTQLIHRIQRPMLDVAKLLPVFVNSLTSAERLMELEELPLEELGTQDANLEYAQKAQSIGVSFRNVSYRYSDAGRNVLNRFSHTFSPGSFTAILGETGAGKTTLIRLMLSLIAQQEGSVEMISEAPRNFTAALTPAHRSLFSYIPQGNTLFSGTIRENLLMGNPNATTDQMKEALHIAMADFVFDLPYGLSTVCSEQGGGLSEGQAQRIAIARAILHPCKILLLDEATSALDVQTEKSLLQNIKAHFADTTIIFVTHRLAVVDFTTDVITMEKQH